MTNLKKNRKICIITGSRAEYGSLYWLLKEIQEDVNLDLQVIATGTHLSPEFGLTYQIIENDGFPISAIVEMLLSSDTAVGLTKSLGLGVIGFADALANLEPDILLLLGDRYEILAAAQAAMIARIPIAHLHGGESTEGAIDEAIRHAITKMAHIHFVGAEAYRRRVIQLGEAPDRVYNFGAVQLDNIEKLNLLNKEEFEKSIEFKLGRINFLVTYHPVTLSQTSPDHAVMALLDALDQFPDAHIIFTGQNSDADGRIIGKLMSDYVARHPEKAKFYTNLGQLRYLSAIKYVDAVIGNSSSGLSEAPAMKKPTINIGNRQKGRLKAESVLDCQELKESIVYAIQTALSTDFQKKLPGIKSIYGMGNVAPRIKNVLKTISLKKVLFKKFYDLK